MTRRRRTPTHQRPPVQARHRRPERRLPITPINGVLPEPRNDLRPIPVHADDERIPKHRRPPDRDRPGRNAADPPIQHPPHDHYPHQLRPPSNPLTGARGAAARAAGARKPFTEGAAGGACASLSRPALSCDVPGEGGFHIAPAGAPLKVPVGWFWFSLMELSRQPAAGWQLPSEDRAVCRQSQPAGRAPLFSALAHHKPR